MIEMRFRISVPFSGSSGMPATRAVPEVGAISVPRVRTVVVLPAPLGPRKPKTSPGAIVKETSSKAVRSPNRLVRWSTTSAAPSGEGSPALGSAGGATCAGAVATEGVNGVGREVAGGSGGEVAGGAGGEVERRAGGSGAGAGPARGTPPSRAAVPR